MLRSLSHRLHRVHFCTYQRAVRATRSTKSELPRLYPLCEYESSVLIIGSLEPIQTEDSLGIGFSRGFRVLRPVL